MACSKAAVLRLKAGREKSLLRRHPWVFSGALESVTGDPTDGETVRIISASGEFLAWGAYSQNSQIRARVWSWDPEETIDERFFNARLQAATAARRALFSPLPDAVRLVHGESDGIPRQPDAVRLVHGESDGLLRKPDAVRLVHGESDGLPGLIVDRYGDWLSVQILSSGPEAWRDVLVGQLAAITGLRNIYERSDVDVRRLEGLTERTGVLLGEASPTLLTIHENGLDLRVDIKSGHKTGFYLDQRRNRLRVRQLAAGRRVLDCFCYSGGFSANAIAGGCQELTLIDASAEALELARENVTLAASLPAQDQMQVSETSIPTAGGPAVSYIQGDVFQELRLLRDRARKYDLIILDPPKFAPTTAQVERAARGYKDINLLAFKLLAPGGLLVTFSCSGGVSAELFQKIVAGAALDAGVDAQIIERLHQDVDHPVALNFPEGNISRGWSAEWLDPGEIACARFNPEHCSNPQAFCVFQASARRSPELC